MKLREHLTDFSKGDQLSFYWKLFQWRSRARRGVLRDILNFFCSRSAQKHGGYIGNGAELSDVPSLPHGLHGIYISRYAKIGADCRIYQNVTIGEVDGKAPQIGSHCFIGAGAVIIGAIHIGNNVKIGAGAVVCTDIPDHCTVVSQKPRILEGSEGHVRISEGTCMD